MGLKNVNNEASGMRDVLGGISKFIKASGDKAEAAKEAEEASDPADSTEVKKGYKEFMFCKSAMLPQRGLSTWKGVPATLAADVLNAFDPQRYPKRTLIRMLGNAPDTVIQEVFTATELGPNDKVPLSMNKDAAAITEFMVSCCMEMYKEKNGLYPAAPPRIAADTRITAESSQCGSIVRRADGGSQCGSTVRRADGGIRKSLTDDFHGAASMSELGVGAGSQRGGAIVPSMSDLGGSQRGGSQRGGEIVKFVKPRSGQRTLAAQPSNDNVVTIVLDGVVRAVEQPSSLKGFASAIRSA